VRFRWRCRVTARERREPQFIKKHQTRCSGFDDKIIALYARGLTVREIQGHLAEIYGVEVSPGLISTVTDEVMEEVKAWQQRPLEKLYPIVYLDALVVKVNQEGRVANRSIDLAIGVNLRGHKEVLGLWATASEGAKFWLAVMTELKQRGVEDFLIACVDGLKGFPEAIEQVFPRTQVQLCLVHTFRTQSTSYARNWSSLSSPRSSRSSSGAVAMPSFPNLG
jgi:putative transposase